jgi:phospholipase/carboxylesterase
LLVAAGYNVEWHTYPMPHSAAPEEIEAVARFLAEVLA